MTTVQKKPENPIIVALDGMSVDDALILASKLSGKVWGFKGNDLLDEPPIINFDNRTVTEVPDAIAEFGPFFADAKYHDIPRTVGRRITKLLKRLQIPPAFITVHASGGIEMMQMAVKAAGADTKILAVSVLTNIDEDNCNLIFGDPVKAKVLQFAKDALIAKAAGIVCSAKEQEYLSKFDYLTELIKVTPAIRPIWHPKTHDQDPKRVTTIEQAMKFGADYFVMGSVFTDTDDPVGAADRTIAEVNQFRN